MSTPESPSPMISEEEALLRFETTARDLMKLSAAGFVAKYKRGEFNPLEKHPEASELLDLVPPSLARF